MANFEGGPNGYEIGTTLQKRGYSMFYGGVEAYDLFYDNWIEVDGEK